jgi:CRISPR/Cas system-associated exonuclease Cas4 (RecB family)
MSSYYNPKRKTNLYDKNSEIPFRISRSKLDLFINCPRCFYLDRKLGISQPPGYPFSLNSAVDKLLKKEFDILREEQKPHPLMKQFGLDAVPLKHDKINEWRDALRGGITYKDHKTNFIITGGIDDIWVTPQKELIIVDYKATAKDGEVNLDSDWQIGYKRQMEIYQWLFRKNGFKVLDTGYFVYCNGKTDGKTFDAKLEFDIKLIPYVGDDSWVEKAIKDAYLCLTSDKIPPYTKDCDFCSYAQVTRELKD